jgi:hypothetical protein
VDLANMTTTSLAQSVRDSSNNSYLVGTVATSNLGGSTSNVSIQSLTVRASNAVFTSNLLVQGPATFSNNVTFAKNATFASNLVVLGSLDTTTVNYSNVYSNVTVYTSETVQSNLVVNGSAAVLGSNLRVTSNVGIGFSNSGIGPAYPLHVISTTTSSNISIYATGDISAFSDARVKTDIQPITGALDKLHAIHGYTFRRTDCLDRVRRMAGVVAQEVNAVLPEVVTIDEAGMMSVAYGNLSALLIEAVKELSDQVRVLAAGAN